MIRYEDLFKECEHCNGEGQVSEKPDPSMGGNYTYSGQCHVCRGTGGEYTDQGEELAKFIRRVRQRNRSF